MLNALPLGHVGVISLARFSIVRDVCNFINPEYLGERSSMNSEARHYQNNIKEHLVIKTPFGEMFSTVLYVIKIVA